MTLITISAVAAIICLGLSVIANKHNHRSLTAICFIGSVGYAIAASVQ